MAMQPIDMGLVFFVYGAAFAFMGVSILRQPKPEDDCRLGRFIWLLALFGLLHGASEWLDFWRLAWGPGPLLDAIRAYWLPLSFLPLLEFGRRLLRPWAGRWASPVLLALPVGAVLFATAAIGAPGLPPAAISRYAVGLPASLLTGIGLLGYARLGESWVRHGRVGMWLKVAGIGFVAYAILTGLVVPSGDGPLARMVNEVSFAKATGLPVQLFRAACATIIGLAMWHVLGAFEAVRERRLQSAARDARQALAVAEQLGREQRLILEVAGDGIIGMDSAGRVTFCNPAASQILGYSAAELHNEDLRALVRHARADGAAHPPEECGIHGLLTVGGLYRSDDEVFTRKDGTAFPVALTGSAIHDPYGGIAGVVITLRDVTERRRREEQLRLRDKAVESAREGIIITDALVPGNPIAYVNPAFTEITGYAAHEVHGRNPSFLQRADRKQAGASHIRQIIGRGGHGVVTLRNYRKDGTLFWNELHVAPVADSAGRITHYVGIVNDVTARIGYEQELEHRAHFDALTGLANRALLKDRLAQAIAHAKRHGEPAAVLFIDLDHFKIVNDGLGHTCGDHLLVEVARRLEAAVRETDTVARLGGDEFVIVISGPDRDDEVSDFARRALDAVARPMHIDGQELMVTASIGASLFPRDGEDGETLLSNADAAMYGAKESGRNNVQYYSQQMNARFSERLSLLGQLRRAIERDELLLHYQPQVALPDGRITGVEALVRWQHPEFGLVRPDRFIPLAEETGLIEPIGEWVLFNACRQATAWTAEGAAPLRVSVNLSARQFRNPNLSRIVRATLDAFGLPPSRLELELTETALMLDPDRSAERLRAIHDLGVGLALDDFGTGYSSLAYLKRFAFDRLKIDRAFVADVIRAPEDAAIARTVIAMAHLLGMETVAEGVETAEAIAYLGRNGCDEVQGYFVSHPLPADALAQTFLSRRHVAEIAALFPEESQRTVLLLDDEVNILRAMQRVLRRQNWKVLTTTDPEEAFVLLARHPVHVVVCDQRMPSMSGTAFLDRIKELYPRTVRIILSGYTDLNTVTEAVNRGWIYKFLTKPWDDASLVAEIDEAFMQYDRTEAHNMLHNQRACARDWQAASL